MQPMAEDMEGIMQMIAHRMYTLEKKGSRVRRKRSEMEITNF